MHGHSRPSRAMVTLIASAAALALLAGGTSAAGASVASPPAPSTEASAAAAAQTASPTVRPATGGGGVPVLAGFTAFDLAEVGYERSEVILSGTATAYAAAEPFGPDGKFQVTPASTAPYTTRAVVARPRDPDRFNGTVVVEWLNVSGGADAGPDWMMAHNQLVREGFAWVGVSAQKVGADATRAGDPERYADLSHPGDSFSYDIYSQAGQALWDDTGTFLGGLRPEQVLAVGESQSAMRMVTYIDAVHPVAEVYDGFLVHSRFAGGTPLSQAPQPSVPVPAPTPIRDDLDVPVIVFQAEGDVASALAARQPDTPMLRYWEVAGTAHFDLYGLQIGLTDVGDNQGGAALFDAMLEPTNQPNPGFTCAAPINTGPAHYVLDAAFHWLDRWVTEGEEPPVAPRLQVRSENPVAFETDAHGNVLGGIRTPAVDAPVATLSGLAPAGGGGFCFLFGTTTPFTPEKLAELYPTHDAFVEAWAEATVAAYEAGFLTARDAWELLYAAVNADIGL